WRGAEHRPELGVDTRGIGLSEAGIGRGGVGHLDFPLSHSGSDVRVVAAGGWLARVGTLSVVPRTGFPGSRASAIGGIPSEYSDVVRGYRIFVGGVDHGALRAGGDGGAPDHDHAG